MPIINFCLSPKARCGKTFIAWLLAQYKQYHSQPITTYDCDLNNLDLSKFKELKVKELNNRFSNEDGSINYRFEPLLEKIKSSSRDILFDLPSQSFNCVINAFRENGGALLDDLKKIDVNVVFHIPISGSEFDKGECISIINEVLSTLPKINVVAWFNHYPKPLFDETDENNLRDVFYEMFSSEGNLKYVVNLPKLTDHDTVTRDNDLLYLKYILQEHRIFGEILDPYKFRFAQEPVLNDMPVFIMSDYQISFLRDEFDRAIAPIAELVF